MPTRSSRNGIRRNGRNSRARRIRPTRATRTPSTPSTTAAAARTGSFLAQVRRSRRHAAARGPLHAPLVAIPAPGAPPAAPHRAGAGRWHVAGDGQAQGGPVAAHDPQVALGVARRLVPRVEAGRLGAGRALLVDGDAPARRAVAGAGEP